MTTVALAESASATGDGGDDGRFGRVHDGQHRAWRDRVRALLARLGDGAGAASDERSYRMTVHLSTRTWVLWFAVDESGKLVCLREDRM